jgi:glycerol kinase
MARQGILAIDQGTTNTKALLISPSGDIVSQASMKTTVFHPQPGWAEQSSADIWSSTLSAIEQALAAAPGWSVEAIGISNQRESVMLWEASSGRPLGPCILWQCRRTSEQCASLRAGGLEALIAAKTGLGIDPLFSATKLNWLLANVAGAQELAAEGQLRGGTVDSWLLWNLTDGVHATDHSNASRTQLLSLDTGSWDGELLETFAVPQAILAEVLPSDSLFGHTRSGLDFLASGIPIHAIMGDSHAAMFGHGIDRPGRIKVTCGTGSSLMTPTVTRPRSTHGLSGTIAWSRSGEIVHALEGNILVSGHAAAFAVRLLGLADEQELAALAETVEDSGGVSFVPALAGMGAPYWRDRARGMIAGMSLATTPAHVARAVFEAIALQIRDVFLAMEADLGQPLQALSVDGGAARNDMLMQLLADLLDRPVARVRRSEVSAIGAAAMAAEALGYSMKLEDEAGADRFLPSMDAARRARILAVWAEAIDRTSFATS